MSIIKALNTLKKDLEVYQNTLNNNVIDVFMQNKDVINDYIAQDQLFEDGKRGDGVRIDSFAPYAPYTVERKREKNQPFDRVTLQDEGDFHESISVKAVSNGVLIIAKDPNDLQGQYGKEILFISESNKEDFKLNYILPELILKFKKAVGI
jgi:hypothetical protein